MGFKTGALVGFAVGYYLGSKAGRERYEQINTWIDQLRDSDALNAAADRAREIIRTRPTGRWTSPTPEVGSAALEVVPEHLVPVGSGHGHSLLDHGDSVEPEARVGPWLH